jgi:DNA-binding response OmpR family regulator
MCREMDMHATMPTPTDPNLPLVPKLTIVDDDQVMQKMLSEYFEQHGMRVATVAGRAGLLEELKSDPSLVILDLHLGQEDGLDLLRQIRAASEVPVIVITGHRREEIDRIVGLELGADDYLTKPFSLRELLARVRSILRRRTSNPESPRRRRGARVRFGAWELDRLTRAVTRDGVAPVRLTKSEYALLHAFLEAPQRPLSREHLLRATRVHDDVFDRSIDVQILRLRRKLETNPSEPQLIETMRGVGYVFRAEVETL